VAEVIDGDRYFDNTGLSDGSEFFDDKRSSDVLAVWPPLKPFLKTAMC